jgi:hypothetical protein
VAATLEADRLTHEGDADGAWQYYLGAIRASRHVTRFGGFWQRSLGGKMLTGATMAASRWINNGVVGPDELRQAISDLGEIRALGAPLVENVKTEYLILRNSLRLPAMARDIPSLPGVPSEWRFLWQLAPGVILYFQREPEQSERVLKHVFASWIREIQKPPTAQRFYVPASGGLPPPLAGGIRIVEAGGSELSGRQIDDSLDSSILARVYLPTLNSLLLTEGREVRQIDKLRMLCAGRLYMLEHGREPKRLKELVGKYIDRLPDEYAKTDEACDAIEAAIEKQENECEKGRQRTVLMPLPLPV